MSAQSRQTQQLSSANNQQKQDDPYGGFNDYDHAYDLEVVWYIIILWFTSPFFLLFPFIVPEASDKRIEIGFIRLKKVWIENHLHH